MLNSMYNVNSANNNFILWNNSANIQSTVTIPHGNYNVYSLLTELNKLMENKMEVIYNVATNTYTYTNVSAVSYTLIPLNSTRLLGLTQTTTILP